MGFKKGNQNIDNVFYGTDYVERMYLGKNQFFQASYLDFYKTNFFSIGLGQEKRQIDNPMGDGAISYIKTEWSSQYGYQLEVKQDKTGRHTNYTDTVFKENFSFMLPRGDYLLKLTIKNIPSSESKGTLGCDLFKKEDNTSLLKNNPVFYNGAAGGFSVDEDTEVYLGMFINDLNVEKTSIFSLELSPAQKVNEKFVENSSLMVRGRKKEIYNSSVSSINITIPETAFYNGQEYPVKYIDSDAFNYEVTENGKTISQPLTKISKITVEGNNMIGFGNRAFKNCSSCTSFSCTSSAFQGGLFANNAAFEGCGALEDLTLSIVKNINGLRESQNLKSIVMGGRDTYSFDDSFGGNTSIETIHWKNKDSFGAEKPFTAHFGISSFEGCTNLKTLTSNDYAGAGAILGEDTIFNVGSAAFAGCTSLIVAGTGFGSNRGPLYSSIGSQAFFGCTGLTSIDFGTREGAETIIGSQAFENCTGITSINLPNTVTSIGSQAFSGCSKLETITIPFIGESATSTNNKFNYIFGTVPTSLTTVGFSKGNNITKIPDYAFENCSNITSINNNDTGNIVSIGTSAYSGTGITSIRLSSALTNVGQSAFSGCTGLTSVRFEKTNNYVNRKIGSSAFDNCVNLTGVEVPGGFSNTEQDHTPWFSLEAAKNWELNDFANAQSNPLYYAKNLKTQNVLNNPSSTSENYVKANYFKKFSSSSIKSFCYIGLTGIQLRINSVAQIGIAAFLGSSFEELHLSFIAIQDEAGALASKAQILSIAFKDVTITNLVDLDTNIPILFYEDAFKNFNISTTNKYFKFRTRGDYWGSLCYFSNPGANPIGQNGVTLVEPVLSVEGVAKVTTACIDTSEQNWAISRLGIDPSKWGYQYCNNLNITSLSIASTQGKTAWTVPIAFCYGCSNLTSFPSSSFNSNVSVVNDLGFYNCNKLSFAINSSQLSVGNESFYNTGVTDITIKSSPGNRDMVIGERAFANCLSLKSLNISNPYSYLDEEKPSIGDEAFAECANLSSVIISQSSSVYKVTIGSGIFKNCNKLEYINIPYFSAPRYRLTQEKWKSTIFNLFNKNPSSYVLFPEIGAYSCVFGERYNLFLPHSLKEFISTSAIDYSLDYTRIGYTFYNNNDGSSPALLFQQGQGKTTVKNSASSYSEKAFKNNNGTIKVN